MYFIHEGIQERSGYLTDDWDLGAIPQNAPRSHLSLIDPQARQQFCS